MGFRKLRWAMDGGGFWDLDVSSPKTLDGLACPVPDDTIPLGLSRGTRLSRPKQLHFLQRFMFAPFVPSYTAPQGLSLQRVLAIPVTDNLFATFLGQFNFQKFISRLRKSEENVNSDSSLLQTFKRNLKHKSLYALGFCSEFLLTEDDTFLVGIDAYGDTEKIRKKAVFHHQFPDHDLTVEAVSPGLFVDRSGNYWDVPFSMAIDLASVARDETGPSYHLCLHHNSGQTNYLEGNEAGRVPETLLPGLCVKTAFSYKKNMDIWRGVALNLKLGRPYDFFLSQPHISASAIIGATLTTYIGDNSVRSQVEEDSQTFRRLYFQVPSVKSSFLAEAFASVSFTAQLGNFQRRFLDLTRFQASLDFSRGSKFISAATHVAQDLLNSQPPSLDSVQALCPHATVSLQQQIGGPFSFRVDSRIAVDLKDRSWPVRVEEPIFAVEYALQVLGSAKSVAWFSPKRKEFMIELRFFET